VEHAVVPAEPKFDEVWSPAPRRQHRPPRRQEKQARPQRPREAAADTVKAERETQNNRGPRRDKERRPDKGNGKRDERRPERRPPPEPKYDPDSPFAALAVLRDGIASRK
jgi:ATP-dependent RNA helicase SUPV3L1/SUV3